MTVLLNKDMRFAALTKVIVALQLAGSGSHVHPLSALASPGAVGLVRQARRRRQGQLRGTPGAILPRELPLPQLTNHLPSSSTLLVALLTFSLTVIPHPTITRRDYHPP